MFVYLGIIAIVLAVAYSCTSTSDNACQEVAGERYDRIDGICYRVEDDGTLVPVPIPQE